MNLDQPHQMTIGGRKLKGTAREVIDRLSGTEPERIDKWFTDIGDVEYPVKQVLAVFSGWPRDFTTADARRFLHQWGFSAWRTDTGEYERQTGRLMGGHEPGAREAISPVPLGDGAWALRPPTRWQELYHAWAEGVTGRKLDQMAFLVGLRLQKKYQEFNRTGDPEADE